MTGFHVATATAVAVSHHRYHSERLESHYMLLVALDCLKNSSLRNNGCCRLSIYVTGHTQAVQKAKNEERKTHSTWKIMRASNEPGIKDQSEGMKKSFHNRLVCMFVVVVADHNGSAEALTQRKNSFHYPQIKNSRWLWQRSHYGSFIAVVLQKRIRYRGCRRTQPTPQHKRRWNPTICHHPPR